MKREKQKRAITPERREQLRAAGKRPESIAAMTAYLAERKSIREDSAAFQRGLLAKVDTEANPGALALILSATASYRAIALLSQQTVSSKAYERIQMLAELLQPLQGELRRTLELLGITAPDSNDGHAAEPTLEDIRREIVEKKREREAATNGEAELV